MPDIQAQTPDGVTHSFPDGTPDDVVDKAVKDYLASNNDMKQTQAAARAGGASPRSTMPILPKVQPADIGTRFASGVVSAASRMNPPGLKNTLEAGVEGPTGSLLRGAADAVNEYKTSRNQGQPRSTSAVAALAHPLGFDTQGIRDRAASGDIAGLAGEATTDAAAAVLPGEAMHAAAPVVGGAVDAAKNRFGVEVPDKLNLPLGFKLKYRPPLPGTGAPLPSAADFYEQRAQDLMSRPDELTQAVEEGRAARLPVRMPKPAAAPPAGPPDPFAGLVSSRPAEVAALPSKPLPPLTPGTGGSTAPSLNVDVQSPIKAPAKAPAPPPSPFNGMLSTRPGEVGNFPAAELPSAPPPTSISRTTTTGPPVELITKNAPKPTKSLIQDPDSAAPLVKKTFQSYPRETLVKMIQSPDTPYQTRIMALAELRRSPAGIDVDSIPGVKYLMEPGASSLPFRNYSVRGAVEVPKQPAPAPRSVSVLGKIPEPSELREELPRLKKKSGD